MGIACNRTTCACQAKSAHGPCLCVNVRTEEACQACLTLESTRHRSGLLAQGKEGGKLLLRYTLQQQFHQDVKSLHTDAWLEHTSSAGQRALQVGDDSKWVVIASSGLQRAAANVGAGGMLKKNLPVSIFCAICCLACRFLLSSPQKRWCTALAESLATMAVF